jgi:hypothetical protein
VRASARVARSATAAARRGNTSANRAWR